MAAFAIFFPERYRINILSSSGSQATYEAIVGSKLNAMRIAAILLLLGVAGVVVIATIAYLLEYANTSSFADAI